MPNEAPESCTAREEAWYSYAIVRAVPDNERGEYVNAGVILFVRTLHFLEARIELNETRIRSLAPTLDIIELRDHLASYAAIANGEPDAGPIAALGQSERFHWLTSPRSTMIQTSAVHVGRCSDPEAVIEDLMDRLVR